MQKILFLSAALIAVLFCGCSGTPNVSPAVWGNLGLPADPVPFMEDVRTGTLPSGLQYFILENSMPENRASLTLAVKAGSVLEEDNEQGLAHFVEHMAFNGTERFPEAELIAYLRSLGMRFGPDVNAYTSFDRTVYGIEVPVETGEDGIRRIPGMALAVIDEWSRAVTFHPEAVENERLVVLEEYRWGLGAFQRIRRHWLPVLFQGSPYANRMPIGSPEVLETAPPERLQGFYERWYRADNMALIIVGDFDGAALEASLHEHFLIERPAVATEVPQHDLPRPRRGIETLIVNDPELTSTYTMLYFRRSREAPRNDLSFHRSYLINQLIENMLDFRFDDAQTDPDTPFTWAGAWPESYAASSRFYVMQAEAKMGAAEASLEELLRMQQSMIRHGFTEAELSLAKNAMLSSLQQMVTEKDRQQSGRFISSLTSFYIDGGSFPSLEWNLEAAQQLLPHISARDINAVIKDYFASGDIMVFIFAPDSEMENLPSEAHIRQMVAQSRRLHVTPPRTITVRDSLLSTIPQQGAIIAESSDTETGAVLWELSNGARIILQSTANRNDEIVLMAMARGGTTSAAAEDDISAGLAAEMLQVSGLGPWSRPELTRQLADKQVSLGYSIGRYQRTFQGSSTSGDLQTFFEMLHLNFTDPRIDTEAVRAMMDTYATSLALRGENPRVVFSDEVNRIITGSHPRFKPLELDDLPRANIDAALAFIKRSLNPADFTFVFTGNLTPDMMRPYVETYLASIPRSESWNTWTDLNIVRPGRVESTVRRGMEDQSRIYMAWYTPASFSEELNITAQALNEYLDIIMTDEIREKLGGVYSIGVGVALSPAPRGELSMLVSFTTNPERVEELTNAVISLLNETARSIDQDAFDKAVNALRMELETSMQSNFFIAQSYMNSAALLELPLARLHRRPQYINAVTPADIQRLCTLLLPNGPALVVLLPE